MNTGIQDAALLGQLLTRVYKGEPESVLDEYEAVRRPIALNVVAFTDRMTRMATLKPRAGRAVRNALMSTVMRLPAARGKLAYQLSELGNK